MGSVNRNLFLVAVLAVFAVSCRETTPPPASETSSSQPTWTLTGRLSVASNLTATGILVYGEGTSLLAMTNEDGEWTLPYVPEGNYRIRAQREDLVPVEIFRIKLDSRSNAVDPPGSRIKVPLVEMTRRSVDTSRTGSEYGSIRGVVRMLHTPDEFEGVIVQVRGSESRTVTNALGEYYFSALPAGETRLLFSRKDLRPAEGIVTVEAGREIPGPIVELRPKEASERTQRTIQGQVQMEDLEGNPLAEFTRVVVSLEGTMHVAVPDSQGLFKFTDLPPGQYAVMATAPGFELRGKVDVDLTALEATEVTVVLDQSEEAAKNLGTVIGTVRLDPPLDPEDHSGIIVSLVGTNLVAVTDLDGFYEIANIPPGTYLFRAQSEGRLPEFVEEVVVRPGEETQLPELSLIKFIEPPRVVYTDPANGTTNVTIRRDTPLFIRFSKQMRPETVKAAFYIEPPVAARLYMGKENPESDFDLLFVELLGSPGIEGSPPLDYDTTYRVTIGEEATDYDDVRLEEPFEFEFTTGKPTIIATRPVDGEQYAFVSHREPLTVEFNAIMDHSSFSPEDIRISPTPVGSPTISLYDDSVSGWSSLRIYTQLDLDKEYTFTFRGNWKTRSGARIENMPYRIKMKTAQFYEYKPYLGEKDRSR